MTNHEPRNPETDVMKKTTRGGCYYDGGWEENPIAQDRGPFWPEGILEIQGFRITLHAERTKCLVASPKVSASKPRTPTP